MNLGLAGKTVAVTGSARGLGREFALAFAREGARLVVSDVLDCHDVADEIEAMGQRGAGPARGRDLRV